MNKLNKLKKAISISIFDFSTLYIKLAHNKHLKNLIDFCFDGGESQYITQGLRHQGAGGPWPPLFCLANRKKGNQGEKERFSKQELLKCCHQGQNVAVLAILECLELKNFSSVFHGPSTLKSISPAFLQSKVLKFVG